MLIYVVFRLRSTSLPPAQACPGSVTSSRKNLYRWTSVSTGSEAHLEEVVCPHPGGEQALVGVSEGGVHEQQALVPAHGLSEALGTLTCKDRLEALRCRSG